MDTKEQGKRGRFDLLDRYPKSIYGGDMWIEYKFCCLRCGFVFAVEDKNPQRAIGFIEKGGWHKRADGNWICTSCVNELKAEVER